MWTEHPSVWCKHVKHYISCIISWWSDAHSLSAGLGRGGGGPSGLSLEQPGTVHNAFTKSFCFGQTSWANTFNFAGWPLDGAEQIPIHCTYCRHTLRTRLHLWAPEPAKISHQSTCVSTTKQKQNLPSLTQGNCLTFDLKATHCYFKIFLHTYILQWASKQTDFCCGSYLGLGLGGKGCDLVVSLQDGCKRRNIGWVLFLKYRHFILDLYTTTGLKL